MQTRFSLCYIMKCSLLCLISLLAFDQNYLHSSTLSKDQISSINGVEKKIKTNQGSLITANIAEYNFTKNTKKYVRLPGNYIFDLFDVTIEYQFTEMTPLAIDEAMSQLLAALEMYGNSENVCSRMYVKNIEINFIINNAKFLNIKSDRCEITLNKTIQFFNNIKSNNSAINERNFFMLDQNSLKMLIATSYFHNKQFKLK